MESRSHSRIYCSLRAGCFWEDVFTFDQIINVSENGAFLETSRSSLPKEKVSLRIFFPRTREPFDVTAEVVWSTRNLPKKKIHRTQGIGIRFSAMEEESKERLKQFIESEEESSNLY